MSWERTCAMWSEMRRKEAEVIAKQERAKARGLAFVSLYAAAKQLVDNFPKRFPYLEYSVKEIERQELAPKLEQKG